jgi:hypothetical protein
MASLSSVNTVNLLEVVRALERRFGENAILEFQQEQPGDVPQT